MEIKPNLDLNIDLRSAAQERPSLISRIPKLAARFALATTLGLGVASSQIGDSRVETEHVTIDLTTEITPDFSGGAVLDTPIGDVSYPVVAGPLRMRANIKDIPTRPTMDLISGRGRSTIGSSLQNEAELIADSAKSHALKSLGLIAGTAALAWIATGGKLQSFNRRRLASGLLAGGLITGVPAGAGTLSFDSNSLNSPKYDGLIADVLKNQDIFKMLDKNDQKITEQAGYLFKLLEQIEKNSAGEEPETSVRILVLSDIHSRNVYPLVKTFIENYDINFIIDAGDLVDWGADFENGFFSSTNQSSWRDSTVTISDLEIPYYFARGNHDSESRTVKALREIANVKIMDMGRFFIQNGLVITGMPDPVFTPDTKKDQERIEKEEIKAGKELHRSLRNKSTDIAVTHNPIAAEQVLEGPWLTISGHVHNFKFTQSKDSQPNRLIAGTSGGAGLRVFNNEENEETEQSFAIINIDEFCNLISIDDIRIKSFDSPNVVVKHIPVEVKNSDSSRICK